MKAFYILSITHFICYNPVLRLLHGRIHITNKYNNYFLGFCLGIRFNFVLNKSTSNWFDMAGVIV